MRLTEPSTGQRCMNPYLHTTKEIQEGFEPFQKRCPQRICPFSGLADQNVPVLVRNMKYTLLYAVDASWECVLHKRFVRDGISHTW